jgi:hypothetical protein
MLPQPFQTLDAHCASLEEKKTEATVRNKTQLEEKRRNGKGRPNVRSETK